MEALNAANAKKTMEETAVVVLQPHRRGFSDPYSKLCESALGRFCLRHKCQMAFEVGRKYADLVNCWRAAHEIEKRQLLEDHPASGLGLGPSREKTDQWKARIAKIDAALTRASCAVRFAVIRLVVDDIDLGTRQAENDALVGLRIVALELGMLEKDHPFR